MFQSDDCGKLIFPVSEIGLFCYLDNASERNESVLSDCRAQLIWDKDTSK